MPEIGVIRESKKKRRINSAATRDKQKYFQEGLMQVRKTEDGIIFKVKVQPKASKNGIAGLYQDALKIRLTAPPVEGKANKALIDFLSDRLRVKKSQLKIVSGQLSKIKVIKVVGEEKDLIQKIKEMTK